MQPKFEDISCLVSIIFKKTLRRKQYHVYLSMVQKLLRRTTNASIAAMPYNKRHVLTKIALQNSTTEMVQ